MLKVHRHNMFTQNLPLCCCCLSKECQKRQVQSLMYLGVCASLGPADIMELCILLITTNGLLRSSCILSSIPHIEKYAWCYIFVDEEGNSDYVKWSFCSIYVRLIAIRSWIINQLYVSKINFHHPISYILSQ